MFKEIEHGIKLKRQKSSNFQFPKLSKLKYIHIFQGGFDEATPWDQHIYTTISIARTKAHVVISSSKNLQFIWPPSQHDQVYCPSGSRSHLKRAKNSSSKTDKPKQWNFSFYSWGLRSVFLKIMTIRTNLSVLTGTTILYHPTESNKLPRG